MTPEPTTTSHPYYTHTLLLHTPLHTSYFTPPTTHPLLYNPTIPHFRFVEQCPVEFLQCNAIDLTMQCTIHALKVNHREAHRSLCKFLSCLIDLAIQKVSFQFFFSFFQFLSVQSTRTMFVFILVIIPDTHRIPLCTSQLLCLGYVNFSFSFF